MRAVTETFILVGKALRLVFRHWPTLLALAFAGYIARQVILRLAVHASDVHWVLGMLVFALVPFGLLIALLLMLRSVKASLPTVTAIASGQKVGVLANLASVLVPFLLVYSSLDYVVDDRSDYAYFIFVDEALSNADVFTNPNAVDMKSRMFFDLDYWSVGVVLVAGLLRYLIGLWQSGRTKTAVRFVGAYLELVWLTLAVVTFSAAKEDLQSRRFAAWANDGWQSVLDALGPLASTAKFIGAALVAADAVILVPLAWLAVGAILYGRTLSQGADLLSAPARKRWLRMPAALRSDVSQSFGPLARGLAMLRHLGLAPMLLFCLIFLSAGMLPDLLWAAERWLIGPQELDSIWTPLSSPLSALNEAIGSTLLICMVAVAVDRALSLLPAAEPSAVDGEPGVAGQGSHANDPNGNGRGVAGRNEEREDLVPV